MTALRRLTYELARSFGGLQVAKFLSRHHPKIFMYHRINSREGDLGLSVNQFRQQVHIIKNEFEPMTLSDLLLAEEQGEIPANAVVVTFDDGYADFADIAFPILRDADVPATLFVTTGFVNRDIWLWPDQIRYAIKRTKIKQLQLSNSDEVFDVGLAPNECWNRISDYCLSIPTDKKLFLIEELFRKLQVLFPESIPDEYRPLSWKKIKEMVKEGLDIGSHSITHPVLTNLDDDQLLHEIHNSKLKIENEVNKQIKVFCYPNGAESDFDDRVKTFVRNSGYRYAVCAFAGKSPIRDPLCINRYPIGENFDFFIKNVYGLSYIAMRR